MTYLILSKSANALLRYPVNKERISIGRELTSDIVLTDEDVSRLHCEIFKKDGKLKIKDQSTNGTYINGNRIAEETIGKDDVVEIGGWKITIDESQTDKQETTVVKSDATKIIAYDDTKKVLVTESIELSITPPKGDKFKRIIRKPSVTIGNSDSNDIVIDDDYISKKHCKLAYENEDFFLIDLGSTNGTYYEGERIDKILFPEGSKFAIGKTKIHVKRVKSGEKVKAGKEKQVGDLIGASPSMKEIFALISRVAPTEATVCITGESGTGKELVARSIHDGSTRKDGPFVAINCGAIPPNIIESELFGHEKGAFTGAAQTHKGVFEQSNKGTLFLDEIGEMPPELQTRLLRALETKKIRRIGGNNDISVDVRIIAATNQELKKNVADGKFREDLFYRLYIIPIHIPPLRERREDIEPLARHFTKIFSADGVERNFTPKTIEKMLNHQWAGNVRELKNTVQRAIIMNQGNSITPSDIVLTKFKNEADVGSLPLYGQEKQAIIDALKKCNGNQSKAADLLGIARTTIAKKITKYEINIKSLKFSLK